MILVDRLGAFLNQISDLIGGSLILPRDKLYNPFPIVFVERIFGGIQLQFRHTLHTQRPPPSQHSTSRLSHLVL